MATGIKAMTLAELGFPNGATVQEIVERLRERGIKLLSEEEFHEAMQRCKYLHWDAQAQAWELRDDPVEWERQRICIVSSF